MTKTKVVFRADGNSEIGLGHVIRSLALAEMLKEDFECVFAIQKPDVNLNNQIETICEQVIVLPSCSKTDKEFFFELDAYLKGKEIVILDGYSFGTDYQKHIKSKECILVCIDDIHSYHFVADVIINHIAGVSKSEYSIEPYTKCYLGPQYALLRPPFLKSGRLNKSNKTLKNIFINMGGADPYNETCNVVDNVIKFDFFEEINVVTGAAYKYLAELKKIIKKDKRIVYHTSINATEIASLMQACGVCICPPSSVSFEYISLGGLIFLKQIADNQKELKAYLVENDIALDYDKDFQKIILSNLQEEYNKMIVNQAKFLDGKSDERLKAIFHKLDLSSSLAIRPLRKEDMMICYEWANDPEVRRASYNSNPIPLQDHLKWFTNKIEDTHSSFYIIEYKSKPIGQIRFEGDKEKVISYLISSEMRGKGLGSSVLKKGVHQLLKDRKGIEKISGYVKRSNIASCKAFEKAGFVQNNETEIPYPDSVKYELPVINEEEINKGTTKEVKA